MTLKARGESRMALLKARSKVRTDLKPTACATSAMEQSLLLSIVHACRTFSNLTHFMNGSPARLWNQAQK